MRIPSILSSRWFVLTRRLFIPVAIGFLAYSAYSASGSLAPLLTNTSLPLVLLACLCWLLAQWIGPLATAAFAKTLALPMGYRELAMISIQRLPAKYLPGGIWQSVARFSAYRERAIRNTDSLTILITEHLIALGVSVTLGGGLLLCIATTGAMRTLAPWIFGSGPMILIPIMIWFSRTRPDTAKTLGWMTLMAFAVVAFWCLAAAAFCTYWIALFGLPDTEILRIAACYLLSWAAGFIAIFAPQGLGVFEWVAAQVLPSNQSMSITVTAVAGFRLVTVFGDLIAWAIAMVISRLHPSTNATRH